MMTQTAETSTPFWRHYFNVDAIDAAVTAGGGQLAQGPQQVPGESWIVRCTDPHTVCNGRRETPIGPSVR